MTQFQQLVDRYSQLNISQNNLYK